VALITPSDEPAAFVTPVGCSNVSRVAASGKPAITPEAETPSRETV
jgi:hypothetical protein